MGIEDCDTASRNYRTSKVLNKGNYCFWGLLFVAEFQSRYRSISVDIDLNTHCFGPAFGIENVGPLQVVDHPWLLDQR